MTFLNAEFMNKRIILLVEDDSMDAELATIALEAPEPTTQVVRVRDGAKALEYLYQRGEFENRPGGNPMLILLDLKMPKVGGLDVLKGIKSNEHLKQIPVIMLTSSRETIDLVECYKHGANAFVVKPMDFDEFTRVLRQLGLFWLQINEPPPAALGAEYIGSPRLRGAPGVEWPGGFAGGPGR
jgi:CheY-like chemotaxis protein